MLGNCCILCDILWFLYVRNMFSRTVEICKRGKARITAFSHHVTCTQTWESSQGGFRRCKPAPECLLVMKTARGDLIGCYLTQWPRTLALRTSQELTGSTYLGTGESFVFSFHKDGEMRKGAWAEGRPTSFLHCSNSLLTVGDAAICVDQYLERVTSRPSKTFNTKEGLLWKDTDAHKFGKRGASGRASGDSCEDNLVSAAETERGPKVRCVYVCVRACDRFLTNTHSCSLSHPSPALSIILSLFLACYNPPEFALPSMEHIIVYIACLVCVPHRGFIVQ